MNDDLSGARGILVGFLLSLPFWVLFFFAVRWLT